MADIMIDIETLGTTPGSLILTIGAVEFDLAGGTLGRELYERISPEFSQSAGFEIDVGTVKWWAGQSAEARDEAFGGDEHPMFALCHLSAFVNDGVKSALNPVDRPCIWSHGFMDIALLEAAYRKLIRGVPWTYRQIRDTRTVYSLAGVDMRKHADGRDIHHNALSDAKVQARALIEAYKVLGLPKTPETENSHG